MASYWHAKEEVASYEQRLADHEAAQSTKEAQQAYESEVVSWQDAVQESQISIEVEQPVEGVIGGVTPIEAAPPPEPPPSPPPSEPPAPPAIYASTELSGPTEVMTLAGPVLLAPPTRLMTAPDGSVFGVLPVDLEHSWIEVP